MENPRSTHNDTWMDYSEITPITEIEPKGISTGGNEPLYLELNYIT